MAKIQITPQRTCTQGLRKATSHHELSTPKSFPCLRLRRITPISSTPLRLYRRNITRSFPSERSLSIRMWSTTSQKQSRWHSSPFTLCQDGTSRPTPFSRSVSLSPPLHTEILSVIVLKSTTTSSQSIAFSTHIVLLSVME